METTTLVEANTQLTGVRGWLAFFCFTLFLRAGLYLMLIVKLILAQKPENVLSVVIAIAMGGVCLMAGIQVVQKKKTAIPLAYASFVVGILSTGFRPRNLLQGIVYGVLWGFYLAKSERVKNTLTLE